MKNIFIFLALMATTLNLFSQDLSNLSEITLSTPEDYKKNEGQALTCADYILGHPVNANERANLECTRFLLRWMEGTPDYTFSLGEDFVSFSKGKTEVSSIYLAALVKAALNENSNDKSPDSISKKAKSIFLDYCANPDNEVKLNRAIKKALKERDS